MIHPSELAPLQLFDDASQGESYNMKNIHDTTSTDADISPDGAHDVDAVMKGQVDPVYEAKANVLNRAVS
jgi:hypothetical protein